MTISVVALIPTAEADDPRHERIERLLAELTACGVAAEARSELGAGDLAGSFVAVFDSSAPTSMLAGIVDADLRERTFLVGCKRPPLCFEALELGFAAGIDTVKQQAWMRPGGDNGFGIIGRRDVVSKVRGKPMQSEAFSSAHYCVYGSTTASKTVPALVEYLLALQEVLAAK